jgi:hypothetical protein
MPTVKKSTCERYDVRDGFDNWAVIMLDEAGGVVSIQSAYGNWGYHWTHHGCKSLKHFLPKMDNWYLVNKLTNGARDFDGEATLKQFTKGAKQTIIETRRERSFSMLAKTYKSAFYGCGSLTSPKFEQRAARQCWDELENLEHPFDANSFAHAIQDSPGLNALFSQPWEDPGFVQVQDRQCTMFAERLWPVFIEAIKQEIQSEAA